MEISISVYYPVLTTFNQPFIFGYPHWWKPPNFELKLPSHFGMPWQGASCRTFPHRLWRGRWGKENTPILPTKKWASDRIWPFNWLVVWLPFVMFPLILGMSSSQLTFIFFRGVQTTNQSTISNPCNISEIEIDLTQTVRVQLIYLMWSILKKIRMESPGISTSTNESAFWRSDYSV